MSTIEERANLYESAHNHRNIFIAYADGAAEQKQIDIEKTCEWMETYFPKELDGYNFEFVKREEIINDFRKAMEE